MKSKNEKYILFTILIPFGFKSFAQTSDDDFMRGVDISFNQQIEDLGGKFKDGGIEKIFWIFLNLTELTMFDYDCGTPQKDKYCGLEKLFHMQKQK